MEVNEYLKALDVIEFDELDNEMKEYANINDVPIIQDEGLVFLRQIVQIKKPKRILEIGSAIGFSAINMAKSCDAIIDTIEISEDMYKMAKINIDKANFNERINIFLSDALELDINKLNNEYDMIFIDAAKSQYIKFFEKYTPLLNKGGIVITDNLVFHGLVVAEIRNKNLRQLVRKIKGYNEWLMNNKDFFTYIYNIGDGLAISIKRWF